ncbi:thiamine ABC transporter substrate binding subunit [Maritalea mediterranea]|uniref:Thiamine-binding periplasmic protein n=1 Tax=Maritalea mediterranea TaxID=2909667 RepID=A0ABS9EA15_9HYPH|nr:thiamine ABC transporter substrate binding subunit [Maritalea mediterranea]MCF4099710.1 thiamine ABC transporter substrate binding subunit [Maritalea mediterranea]
MSFQKIGLAALVGFSTLVTAAVAQDKPTLTIYTYDSFAADWGPGPQLKAGFEQNCNCEVDFVAADSSISALRKAQLEGPTTEADIILGLDTSVAAEARNTQLFTDHNVDLSALELPVDYASDKFVPFDYGYFAFVYDSSKIDNPPSSFEDLAAMDEEFKIAIQDPRSSTPGLGLVLWMKAAKGDQAEELWRDIAPNILTVTKGWSEAYGLFLEGEVDMVLSYSSSPSYHRIAEEEDKYLAAQFEEGHYVQIELAGILESSDQKELANQFLDYLVSQDGQAIIPTTNWMFPVVPLDDGLPEGFDTPLPEENSLILNDETVGQNTKQYIDDFFAAIGQ